MTSAKQRSCEYHFLKSFGITRQGELKPRSTDCEADTPTTTPSRRKVRRRYVRLCRNRIVATIRKRNAAYFLQYSEEALTMRVYSFNFRTSFGEFMANHEKVNSLLVQMQCASSQTDGILLIYSGINCQKGKVTYLFTFCFSL